MGINKIIPKGLSSDTDERLVKNGFMPDATNVTLSEGGSGTESILKNCKGTIPGEPFKNSDKLRNYESKSYVIGEVSDPQRGFIYFFVAIDEGKDAIYQYNVETDKYRLVLTDTQLGFESGSYIKADVVNGAFQQDGVVQTILYFTDNVNPPRKINVDRALAGDYNNLSLDKWDYSVNTIKAAPIKAPTANFNTTEELPHNNFKTTAFQFATQIIYVDGEESAISPYSKLSYPERLAFHGIEESSPDESIYQQVRLVVDNTCEISINIDPEILTCKDVSKIRLIAREGNTSAFYIIDEFDPNEDLVRQVYGQDITVYDGDSKSYKFFNDILGATVPTPTEDKLFDNVPLKARGQTVVGNRLMYSNYEEGRPNHEVRSEISVKYNDDTALKKEFIIQDERTAFDSFVDSNLGFLFRPLDAFIEEPDQSTLIPAGSILELSFNVKIDNPQIQGVDGNEPIFEVELRPNVLLADGSDYFEADAQAISLGSSFVSSISNSSYTYALNSFTIEDSASNLGLGETAGELNNQANISISVVTPSEFTIDQFVEYLADVLNGITFRNDYTGDFRLSPTQEANDLFQQEFQNYPNFGDQTLPNVTMTPQLLDNIGVYYKFVCETNNNNTINVSIEVDDVEINYPEFNASLLPRITADTSVLITTEQNNIVDSVDLFENGLTYQSEGGLIEEVSLSSPSGTTLVSIIDSEVPYAYSIVDLSPIQGFKSGALHPLGIIYKDKWGRSSFVNKLGSAYVGWYNDHDRLKDGVFKYPGETILKEETLNGPASISIKFLNNPPDWADSFQIVYPGNSLTDSFIQYSAVGAFVARKGDFTNGTTGEFREIDTESKRIYVSFEVLDIYRDQKNTLRDYSFTVGDKLRIKSAANLTSTLATEVNDAYFSATDGGVVEFDVVGVELLTNDVTNPIAYNVESPDDAHGPLAQMDKRFIGKFLVLEAPQIAGGAESLNGDQIKYVGWDWYHISYENTVLGTAIQTPYPDGTVVEAGLNYWQRQPIVEIYNPKKSTANQFYYEIGEAVTINRRVVLPQFDTSGDIINPDLAVDYLSYHGPDLVLNTGDVHYRPVACKTADWRDEDGAGNTDGSFEFRWFVKDDWVYKTKVLEDFSPSDIIDEKMWSKGRAHVEFKNAATVRRFNGLTYSDAYEEDVANLSLSSFNATLTNFGSLESKYGAINYICNYGSVGELLALQENKLSKTGIKNKIFFDAAGGQNVALSTDVIGSTRYFVGDYGCGDHPEAVLVYDNDVFFVDVSRKKVLRVSGDQMVPISDKDMSSTFNDIFDDWGSTTPFPNKARKIVSGYDPDEETYYATFYADTPYLRYIQDDTVSEDFSDLYSSNEFRGYTLSYDVARGHWQSKHSFIPTIYSNQNNKMYSCKYVYDASDLEPSELTPLLFHRHDDLLGSDGPVNRTVFYNQSVAQSDFTVISNASPSAVKVYDALSYEGSKEPDSASIASSNGSKNDKIDEFVEREDSFYVMIPRDTSTNSTSHVRGIGRCIEIDEDNNSITIKGSLIGVSIPNGSQVFTQGNQQIGGITGVNRVEGNKIFFDQGALIPESVVGQNIILVSISAFDGDAIRGHYATIKSEFRDNNIYEVYCVNAHVTNSQLHHSSNN